MTILKNLIYILCVCITAVPDETSELSCEIEETEIQSGMPTSPIRCKIMARKDNEPVTASATSFQPDVLDASTGYIGDDLRTMTGEAYGEEFFFEFVPSSFGENAFGT